jgi:hypothetical protein
LSFASDTSKKKDLIYSVRIIKKTETHSILNKIKSSKKSLKIGNVSAKFLNANKNPLIQGI